MIFMKDFSVFIPQERMSILDASVETGLSKSILSVYKLIYGLNEISIWRGDLSSLLIDPIFQLVSRNLAVNHVDYLIYVHTASWVSLAGADVLSLISQQFDFSKACCMESSLYKCVGYFKVLELLLSILRSPSDLALVLTGEVAFTPKLRVVPRSTLVGDASTASLFSTSGLDHQLLSVKTHLIPGYEKGIYLCDKALISFELIYISQTVSLVETVLKVAGVSIQDIKVVLPHNVNIPTWEKIALALNIPLSRVYLKNIPVYAHTFSSDHLINLESILNEGLLKKGDLYLMVACGLGFFISAALWRY